MAHRISRVMSFSGSLACFAGSLLLALPGRTTEPTTVTNITFRNHVQPVLAKFGCSSGACHGAAAGQNGFKLSLRGYDDEGDYLALTRQALGRRIIPADPGRSLFLLKPTAAIPHGNTASWPNGFLPERRDQNRRTRASNGSSSCRIMWCFGPRQPSSSPFERTSATATRKM